VSGRARVDRLFLAAAALGLALSLGLHVAILAAGARAPAAPWSWLVHAGAVVAFWWAAGRIGAAGLRGLGGLLRIRRMIPIPVRLALGAATANALVSGLLAARGHGAPGRALTAYWTMMYLLVAVLFTFVVLRLRSAGPPAA
jgi:hypothetical protein